MNEQNKSVSDEEKKSLATELAKRTKDICRQVDRRKVCYGVVGFAGVFGAYKLYQRYLDPDFVISNCFPTQQKISTSFTAALFSPVVFPYVFELVKKTEPIDQRSANRNETTSCTGASTGGNAQRDSAQPMVDRETSLEEVMSNANRNPPDHNDNTSNAPVRPDQPSTSTEEFLPPRQRTEDQRSQQPANKATEGQELGTFQVGDRYHNVGEVNITKDGCKEDIRVPGSSTPVSVGDNYENVEEVTKKEKDCKSDIHIGSVQAR